MKRREFLAISGAALLIAGTLLTGLDVGPWHIRDLSVTGLVSGLLGAWLLLRAHKR